MTQIEQIESNIAIIWQEIMDYRLPKKGDLVWWNGYGATDCAGPELVTLVSGHNFRSCKEWKKAGYTHFAPVNPPTQEQVSQ